MKTHLLLFAGFASLLAMNFAPAEDASKLADPFVPVTADNFIRAETDLYFGNAIRDGGLGKMFSRRDLMSIDKQFVVRGNRDTLYSSGVFDLAAGPVTISSPT